jgi:hypothetical protein
LSTFSPTSANTITGTLAPLFPCPLPTSHTDIPTFTTVVACPLILRQYYIPSSFSTYHTINTSHKHTQSTQPSTRPCTGPSRVITPPNHLPTTNPQPQQPPQTTLTPYPSSHATGNIKISKLSTHQPYYCDTSTHSITLPTPSHCTTPQTDCSTLYNYTTS